MIVLEKEKFAFIQFLTEFVIWVNTTKLAIKLYKPDLKTTVLIKVYNPYNNRSKINIILHEIKWPSLIINMITTLLKCAEEWWKDDCWVKKLSAMCDGRILRKIYTCTCIWNLLKF